MQSLIFASLQYGTCVHVTLLAPRITYNIEVPFIFLTVCGLLTLVLCSSAVNMSGWINCMCHTHSFCLILRAWPVCPTYLLRLCAMQYIKYMPGLVHSYYVAC